MFYFNLWLMLSQWTAAACRRTSELTSCSSCRGCSFNVGSCGSLAVVYISCGDNSSTAGRTVLIETVLQDRTINQVHYHNHIITTLYRLSHYSKDKELRSPRSFDSITTAVDRNRPKSTMSEKIQTNGVKVRPGLVREDLRDYCPASNLAFNEKIKLLLEQGQTIYHFGFGQAPFPVLEEMVEALKENAHQNAYLPVAGIPALRDALAKFHKRYDGLEIDSSQIIVGPGTKELIFLLLTVFRGDVMVVSPSWTTYKPQSQLAHHKPYIVETSLESSWRITPEALKKTIADNHLTGTKVLILCNPDNPTGACYEKEHLMALSEACRQHDVLVISDEIYGRLHYEGCHQSIAKFYPEGTILSSGMSKWASAGGWRLGYHIYPKELSELQNAVKSAASHSYSCAPAPMQYAVAKAMTNTDTVDQYIKHTTRIMKAVASYCYRELSSVGVKVLPSTGGYYIFPDFEVVRPALSKRGINTGDAMCQAMFKEAKVALMSGGPAFLRPETEFTTRLCYVNFDGTEALKQSRQIGLQSPLPDDFVAKYAKSVYDGIQALKLWVQKQTQV